MNRTPARLIVASNRLPYNLPRKGSTHPPKRNVGGLVNALEPVLAAHDGCWIGWDGSTLTSGTAVASTLAAPRCLRTESGVDLLGVPLSERELSRYYHGLCNRTLWPLFHNQLDKAVFQGEAYAAYARINRRFAEVTMAYAAPDDRIWIHDYHLMLLPRMLRGLGFRGRIDFFLHIPFPAPEIFRTIPWRVELIEGLLGANSVAFHVRPYLDNFIRVIESLFPGDGGWEAEGADVVVHHRSGDTIAGAAPIGIDVEEFERIAALPAVRDRADRILRMNDRRRLILGADRLDYTKGIKERLLAIERLLIRHPRFEGRFTLLQVVVPSRNQVEEYRVMKREIDRQVGRINGEFSREDWQPIHYAYRALSREELVARYRAAAIALVTPLKDGMNLVAPEFVASRTDDDGVLVVSEFAGVAQYLPDALRVNPYDLDGCADALAQALEMDIDERRARMQRLRERVKRNTITAWYERCADLGGTRSRPGAVGQWAARPGRPHRRVRRP